MRRTILFIVIILELSAFEFLFASSEFDLFPVALKCNNKTDPIGVDTGRPFLSWQINSTERNVHQSAYRICAASSQEKLSNNEYDLWDSGKIQSDNSLEIEYNGHLLKSGQKCYWKVRVWNDSDMVSPWSKTAHFETGLLYPADWTANWISDGKSLPKNDADFYKNDPAPLFRKEFSVLNSLKRARLYITGLGYYEAYINGKRVGNRRFDPAWTSYSKRILYSVYDVVNMLQNGKNTIGVILGNGWYNPLPMKMWGKYNFRNFLTIGRPRFIAQLIIEYTNGIKDTLCTDHSWKTADSPILRNNVYLGEVYDARLQQNGWNLSGFNDSTWHKSRQISADKTHLHTQEQPPIRITKEITPIKINYLNNGKYIFDFGVNFAGSVRLKTKGKRGTKIILRYGELLHEDGSLNPMTSVAGQIKRPGMGGPGAPDTAWQSDTYILSGNGQEIYMPRFAFRGFRYVEISGLSQKPTKETLSGLRMNADVAPVGSFSCSNEMFNKIYEISRRTFLSNLFSVQSDCPHREKFGYGGDIVSSSEALMFDFDMNSFYQKVINDFADAVRPNGGLTETAPFVGIHYGTFGDLSAPIGWGFAFPLLLKQLYQYYGVRHPLAQQFDTARNWFNLLKKNALDYIIEDGISDHESLDKKPVSLSGTAFFYKTARLISWQANMLGREEEAQEYAHYADTIKASFIHKFLKPGTGKIGKNTQAAQAFALYFDLLPRNEKRAAAETLYNEILTKHDGHLSTGIFGTKYMLDVLSHMGRADIAYIVVNQKDFPGWGYMLEKGATTLWEHWAFSDNTYSHNHPMFGSVSEWFIKSIAGIKATADAVGFNKIIINPALIKGLTHAEATYHSVRGKIVSAWNINDDVYELKVEIPANTNAKIYLPAKSLGKISESGRKIKTMNNIEILEQSDQHTILKIGSGKYTFCVKF